MEAERSNRGMISVTKIDVTVEAFLLVMGKTSPHPVKVSTNTRSYLILFTGGICVKSTCQSMERRHPLAWWVKKGGGLILELGIVPWKIE
jgi:hypothetical protein